MHSLNNTIGKKKIKGPHLPTEKKIKAGKGVRKLCCSGSAIFEDGDLGTRGCNKGPKLPRKGEGKEVKGSHPTASRGQGKRGDSGCCGCGMKSKT